MAERAVLDRAGRVVIPKSLRRQLRLEPGDAVSIEAEADRLMLKPIRPAVGLKKKRGVWVYYPDQDAGSDSQELLEREREKRIRELARR